LRRRPALRQHHRFSQCGFLIQVGEYLVDDHRVFDTGESLPRERSECFGYDFERTTTLGAGFYVDIA